MKPRRRIWYHCSSKFHGQVWDVGMTCPPASPCSKEPRTPRLAVCDSVVRCFTAQIFKGDVFVYKTEKPRSTVKPIGVYDQVVTQERWIIPPVRMVLSEVVQSAMVEKICGPTFRYVNRVKAAPHVLMRVFNLQTALEHLDPDGKKKSDRRFVEQCLKYIESRHSPLVEKWNTYSAES